MCHFVLEAKDTKNKDMTSYSITYNINKTLKNNVYDKEINYNEP